MTYQTAVRQRWKYTHLKQLTFDFFKTDEIVGNSNELLYLSNNVQINFHIDILIHLKKILREKQTILQYNKYF